MKICGVLSPEIAQAARIVAALPPFVSVVGVFVDTPADEVLSLAHGVPLDAVQLHGEEPPEMIEILRAQGVRVLKAVKVGERVDVAEVERYRAASALMLDTRVDGLAGGSGHAFDWNLAKGLSDRFPLILSGGLVPENVTQALEIVRPFGVDVSSGVETDEQKDPEKIRKFIKQVRQWESVQ